MATIEINNVTSRLVDAPIRVKGAVNDALGVETPGYEFVPSYRQGFWDGKTRFFKMQSGKFPTGLLQIVADAMIKAKEEVVIQDTRTKIEYTIPDKIVLNHAKLGTITLRDYQYESVVKGLSASRGVVNVATNGGKTEIGCGIIQCILPHLKTGQRIAFFTHSTEIFHQTHARIEERLGIKVGKIGDSEWDEQQVTLVMIPTVGRYLDPKKVPKKRGGVEGDAEKHKAMCKKTKEFFNSIVGFIGDEVHHASSDTWYDVFNKLEKAYFRFGLTGTIDESNMINVFKLYGCTGKIITKINNAYLIDKGYSARPTLYLMAHDSPSLDGYHYRDALDYGIIQNDVRNSTFVDKIVERTKMGKQALVIVNETEHGDILVDMLENEGIECMFTHGKKSAKYRKEALAKLTDGSLRVLVATTVLDEGVDVSGINCLFLVSGGKSLRQILQRIGRGLRKKDDGSGIEVYDALDYNSKHLTQHTLERYEIYKSEGFEIIKLEI